MTNITLTINSDINPDKIVTFISEKCRQENLQFELDIKRDPSKDAINKQREFFSKPLLIGDNIAIKVLTARNKHFKILDKYTFTDRTVINIEPKGSFGMGTHPTTQMCISAIEKYLKQGMNVLDIGCGSGILSIVSLLFGANYAVGVDINKSAVEAAKINAELNHISDDKLKVIHGNLIEEINEKYDLVVANMLTDPIKVLLPDISNYMGDNAFLILSGIVDFRESEITTLLQDNHLNVIERLTDDDWVCLIINKMN